MAQGWGGKASWDDAEARERIIDAARCCIDPNGPYKTDLSDVSGELGARPKRSPTGLRAFLHRWVPPAVRVTTRP